MMRSGAGETKTNLPRAYAYARKHLLMHESMFAITKLHLESFAKLAGYELAEVFVEQIGSPAEAFGRLLDAVTRDELSM